MGLARSFLVNPKAVFAIVVASVSMLVTFVIIGDSGAPQVIAGAPTVSSLPPPPPWALFPKRDTDGLVIPPVLYEGQPYLPYGAFPDNRIAFAIGRSDTFEAANAKFMARYPKGSLVVIDHALWARPAPDTPLTKLSEADLGFGKATRVQSIGIILLAGLLVFMSVLIVLATCGWLWRAFLARVRELAKALRGA